MTNHDTEPAASRRRRDPHGSNPLSTSPAPLASDVPAAGRPERKFRSALRATPKKSQVAPKIARPEFEGGPWLLDRSSPDITKRATFQEEKVYAAPAPPGVIPGAPGGLPMLSPSNACRILRRRTGGAVSRATFYRWLRNGKVYSIRVGLKILIPWPALDELIQQCLAGERSFEHR